MYRKTKYMYLHYHKNNFYWFKGLNIKRVSKLLSNLEISDEYISNIENGDNRKKLKYDKNNLFLLNLYIGKSINKFIDFYAQKNIRLYPIDQKFPLTFSCMTEKDNGLKLHCDTSLINTNFDPRYFGCNIYLNDDYFGGELVFPFMDLKIKPEPGDLITYRSNIEFPHYVKKVTQGQKWLLQGYFRIRGDYE